jgi:TolB-like protein/Flp pilus assembly protein TadD
MPTNADQAFSFETYTLDLRRGSLRTNDHDIELRPKSFELLCYLTERAGRLIAKDELIAAIWPNVTVSDESLARCVSDIRLALNDRDQRIIKTVPRRGYLFAASVVASSAAAESGPKTVPPLSIVVLPFVNLGGDPGLDSFADAITDTLTTDLSRMLDACVVAPDTALAFRGKQAETREIRRELGVRYVIRGRVQGAGEAIRIKTQLIDADTRAQLWAERFDKPRADPLAMQDEISSRLWRALHLAIINAEANRSEQTAGERPDATTLAIRAWAIFQQASSRNQIREAQGLFEAALRLDKCHLSSLLGLASTLQGEANSFESDDPEGQLRRAEAAIAKALTIAPDNALARYMCAEVYYAHAPDRALRELEIARRLDPTAPWVHAGLGLVKIFLGRAEEAEQHIAEATRLSPRDPKFSVWHAWLGHADLSLGRFEHAAHHLRASVELAPGFGITWFNLAAAEAALGHHREAANACAMGRRLMPHFSISKAAAQLRSNNPAFEAQRQRIREMMRKAGVPE